MRLLIVILFLPFFSFGQPLLEVEDNVFRYWDTYVKELAPRSKKDFNDWYEGKTIFMSFSNPDTTKPYLVISGEFLTGVYQKGPADWYYIFDVDGDGVLDYKTEEFLLPYSVFIKTAKKSKKNNVKVILDLLFETYQSDSGPIPRNVSYIHAKSEIKKYHFNRLLSNRDIIYMINYYLEYAPTKGMALDVALLLEESYQTRFKKRHPIITFFKGEALYKNGDFEAAKEVFESLLKKNSKFLPAKYYILKIANEKKELDVLRLANINHWIFAQ